MVFPNIIQYHDTSGEYLGIPGETPYFRGIRMPWKYYLNLIDLFRELICLFGVWIV